jgi:glutamate dehydrogenase
LSASSWADYNPKLISTGGGVYSRQDKSITLSAEAQHVLGINQAKLTPNELMQAILRAPTELLYFGGIGTYLKGSNQSHLEVGDKANDGIRVNGNELRCQVVGEGANLGVTQSGRIEFARHGGKINTDFVDNSAGVDTSDHEVNIKILLQALMSQNKIDEEKRVALLKDMTEEVAAHVLQDNYDQSLAISLMEHTAHADMAAYAQFIRDYEKIGLIQRKLENLPDDEGMQALVQRKQSLTRPDLAVILAYAKMHVYNDILDSDAADKEAFSYQLLEYFPEPLRAQYHDTIMNHRLRREIIATAMTNVLINRMGPAFVHGESQRLNVKPALLAQSWLLVRSIFDLRTLWQDIDQLDNVIPATEQNSLYQAIADSMGDATKWFIRHYGDNMDLDALIPLYRDKAQKLHHWLKQQDHLVGLGFTPSVALREDIQARLDFLPYLAASCDITALSSEKNYKMDDVAHTYFAIEKRLQLTAMSHAISALPVDNIWTQEVQENLHKDLNDAWLKLCEAALKHSVTDIDTWLERYSTSLQALDLVLKDLPAQTVHVNMLTVAIQRLRQLADSVSTPAL